jgi:hypothetical protein
LLANYLHSIERNVTEHIKVYADICQYSFFFAAVQSTFQLCCHPTETLVLMVLTKGTYYFGLRSRTPCPPGSRRIGMPPSLPFSISAVSQEYLQGVSSMPLKSTTCSCPAYRVREGKANKSTWKLTSPEREFQCFRFLLGSS